MAFTHFTLSANTLARLFSFAVLFSACLAQSPATDIPVPPLQWIDLTSFLSGSSPPGLKYASMGFDPTSRTVILFGGEANGFPVQQTYLLNVTSLTWSAPSPPSGLDQRPPPRSAAVSGTDFAASNRHGYVVIGGKGLNGQALDDAWEFNFINQFWSPISISPGGPSPRWGASGGTDTRAQPVPDPVVPGPNNTFYLAGGFDGQRSIPLSDAWVLQVAGVLSPNNPNSTVASWTSVQISGDLPSKVRQGGVVMPSARIVAAGGCSSDEFDDAECAQQDSHILHLSSSDSISPGGCSAPRVGPVLLPNFNPASSSFASQTLMLAGLFNESLWDDDNGLARGEVDILDVETGSWARVLPSGDPGGGTNQPPRFPRPREGAAAVSYPFALVGSDPSLASDTIIFGGQDANGTYLNDVWLLRAYMGSLTESNQTWSGFGDGSLQTGADATGSGVTVQYMTTCAVAIAPTPTEPGSPTGTGSPSPTTFPVNRGPTFDTDVVHKVLSPASIALLLASLLVYRLASPPVTNVVSAERQRNLVVVAIGVGCAAYAAGVIGLVVSFTSIASTTPAGHATRKRSLPPEMLLHTGHGRAGLAFFVALYGILPLLYVMALYSQVRRRKVEPVTDQQAVQDDRGRKNSTETGLTSFTGGGREGSTVDQLNVTSTPAGRRRTSSWQGGRHFWSGLLRRSSSGRRSSESGPASPESAAPTRSFEVLNRGARVRRLSSYGGNGHVDGSHTMPRSLSDLNWLDRRRSLNAVGELDYALTQMNAGSRQPNQAAETQSTRPLIALGQSHPQPSLPSKYFSALHILLHALVLGISAVALVALWTRAPKVAFSVYLLVLLAFYVAICILAWNGRPRESILTVLLNSIRHHSRQPNTTPPVPSTPQSSRPLSTANEFIPFPGDVRGPYTYHQPLVRGRPLSAHTDDILSSNYHDSNRPDDVDDVDEDDEVQRRIEQEMDRRDVSIVTVPKRKLWIANPS